MFAALELDRASTNYSCRSHRMNVITTYTRGDHPGPEQITTQSGQPSVFCCMMQILIKLVRGS